MRRRDFISLASVAIVAGPSILPAPVRAKDIEDLCEYHAKRLSEALQCRHGGKWRISIDKNVEFVLISKIL